jgi:DNA helicase-2/ATP-dependent DNA helicase PcrA
MSPSNKESLEKYVFEFYEEEEDLNLELDTQSTIEMYNDVDFQANLNDEQFTVIQHINGPMLIIAGAGSGKTRTIVYSVAKLLVSGAKPGEIMLVTFTNKAAHEMINRVETLLGKKPKGIWAGTFHSLANRFLRIYAKKLGMKPNYTILDESDAKSLMKLAMEHANTKEVEERFPTAAIAKEILSFSINCNKTIKEVIQWKFSQFDNEKVIAKLNEVYKVYAKKKESDALIDFDDLLVFWNKLLDERDVAKSIAKKIKYILVDEYQDTNFIQDEIIYKIASQNPDKNVLAVGDDAQSIYAFRGANFENILKFEQKYKNCQRYAITYNYRSTPEILDLANDSINKNKKQFKKKMKSTRKIGIKPFQVNVNDDKDQARFIVNQILKLHSEGFNFSDIAILVRAGHHTFKIELELQAKNIPYEVRAGVAFFERAHIKDVVSHLKIIENPYDEIAWNRVFSIIPGIGIKSASKIFEEASKTPNPLFKITSKSFFRDDLKGSRISAEGIKNIQSHLTPLSNFSSQDNPSEIIQKLANLLEDHMKGKYENWQDRLEDLKQLSIYAQSFSSIQKFLENLSLNASIIESKTVLAGDQVQEEKPLIISTIHRAKGLEWRVVFIPMLSEEQFPSSRVVGDADALEEERRVFYVAMTRAKDQLYLISPALIQSFGGNQTARLSQFVLELDPRLYQESMVRFKSKIKSHRKRYSNSFQSADELLKK